MTCWCSCMRHPRQAFTREQLLEQVWNWSFGDTSTVTVHVRRLREKLEADPALPQRIATVWGVGYRYEPEAAMITAAELWMVSYTVAGIAAAAAAAGMIVLRLLAARSVATSLTVVAAVTIAATLAGVVVISLEMFISRKDLNVVLAVVAIAGIAGFAVALLLGRRVLGGQPPAAGRRPGGGHAAASTGAASAVLPAELAGLSAALRRAHGLLAEARDRERALEASRRELVAWVSHDLRTPLAGLRAMAEALEDGVVTDWPTVSRYHTQIRAETDRLALMIDDLFELSRIHAGALRLSRQVVGPR